MALVLPAAANAQVVRFTAQLNGANETPAPILTGAAGSAEVFLDVDNKEFLVILKVYNFPTGTTASHIHVGGPGLTGPVVINFPLPTGVIGDVGTLTFRVGQGAFVPRPAQGINTLDDMIQAILNGNSYVNVHSQANPGGEIRGPLVITP
jgi:hypothetical protein